ncbi:hypothetical protein BDV06DRAFT_200139 [Aspergillus oleicola]
MASNDGRSQTINSPSSPAPSILPPTLAPGVAFKPELITYPDPVNLYLLWLGPQMWESSLRARVHKLAAKTCVDLQRPVTQPEYDFFTETGCKMMYHGRSGILWGFMGSIAHTAVKYRRILDQYKPTPRGIRGTNWFYGLRNMYKLDSAVFGSYAWGFAFRTSIWVPIMWFFTVGYAMTECQVDALKDSRMRQWIEDMKGQSAEELMKRRNNAALVRAHMKTTEGGSFSSTQVDSSERGWSEEPSSAESSGTMYTTPSPSGYSGPYSYSAPSDQGNSGKSFLDDDASPIAADYQDTAPQSAWDRIRQQNQSQSQQASRQRYSRPQPTYQPDTSAGSEQNSSSPGSAWDRVRSQGAWVGSANDKEQERERAQAEFNRMLDAERARGEQDSGSKGGPTW